MVRSEPFPHRIYELTRRIQNAQRKQMDNNARWYEVDRGQGEEGRARAGPG